MTNPEQSSDLPAQYDAGASEHALYQEWEAAGVFRADAAESKRSGGSRDPFVLMMPPPNVTAILHVGHGLNNTVQDVLARWRRMAGDEVLWVPGTDHAGIATQNVVEKQLAAEGTSRDDLGRAAFVERVRAFADLTRGEILQQLRVIGSSADWTRTAYTFSPELSRAVREVFVRLYDDGLIYRGHRVIHWCSRCLTSLSDEEAEFEDEDGSLFTIRYPLADDPSSFIDVATTRPETLPGDVAVAVHPKDKRYTSFVGRMLRHPVNGLSIPVIADDYVDLAFGTGALKITPAHDPNDFEVGKRHKLPQPVILSADGHLQNDPADGLVRTPPDFAGLDRKAGRDLMVRKLKAAGALIDRKNHRHAVRHCYRCETVVEPRLSDQWFVKMAPLAKPALEAVRDGRVRILPERHNAVYVQWMENIRDWNISRQIWWGHRIPVWKCEKCGTEKAYREDPAKCETCGGAVTQDPDVLDTWFSSWLWPFSTLGWPDETADLKAFYPTDVLVTAPEILFFWVARMIMGGFYCMGELPFHSVYLTGTVRDMEHRKMSKSLGNGIDPLVVVRKFGADALRYTLMQGMGLGVDVMLDPADLEKSFAPGRNFATKLWNIGRFLLMQVGTDPVTPFAKLDQSKFRSADRWIIERLGDAIDGADSALGPARPASGVWHPAERQAGLRLDEYTEVARRFVWNELADWYVEACKARLAQPGADRETARSILVHTFDQALRLLHPVMPFITESLWRKLPGHVEGSFLATAAWPVRAAAASGTADAQEFAVLQEAIQSVRQLRSDYAIPPAQAVTAHVVGPAALTALIRGERALFSRLARCEIADGDALPGAAAHVVLPRGLELVLPLAGIVDLAKESAKLENELGGLEKQLNTLRGRLANEKFTSKAPTEVVDAERVKEREWSARADQLRAKWKELAG
ncbi:MAG TPA: valine--tRNA ligase [Gemmatimonadaceae bacterium]